MAGTMGKPLPTVKITILATETARKSGAAGSVRKALTALAAFSANR